MPADPDLLRASVPLAPGLAPADVDAVLAVINPAANPAVVRRDDGATLLVELPWSALAEVPVTLQTGYGRVNVRPLLEAKMWPDQHIAEPTVVDLS